MQVFYEDELSSQEEIFFNPHSTTSHTTFFAFLLIFIRTGIFYLKINTGKTLLKLEGKKKEENI